MRLFIVLSVAAAVAVMLGAILVAASVIMRLLTRHQPAHLARLGLDVITAGIAFGLVVLVVFATARIGTAGRSRPSAGTADHRGAAAGRKPAASRRQGASSGHGRSQGSGEDRLGAGAPSAGSRHAGSGQAGRDGGARRARPRVLTPTNVYSPGGLIDVPREGRAPGSPGSQPIPEILRTARPGQGAPADGRSQDRIAPGRAGVQPRPGYQPGMGPGSAGRAPYAPGGQPPPSVPPRDHMRSREAPRTGVGMPPRGSAPPQKPRVPREAPPPGRAGPPREGMPSEGMGAGGPIRPGSPMLPRDPASQPTRGQGSGAGRHAGGPGYAAPAGRGQGSPGHSRVRSAGPGRPTSVGQIADPARPSDPARSPGSVRRAVPPDETPADVYIYRDTGGQTDDPVATPQPDENDPAYWYDLPGTGSGGAESPRGPGGGPPNVPEKTRGPFEPLVSSADLPGTSSRFAASPEATEPVAAAPDAASPGEASDAAGDGQEDPADAHARKLEQIKDLYLTAEAIGEANVAKHFDEFLAQQRELIGEYFRQSSAARAAGPAGPADRAEAGPEGPAAPAGASESARVAADQPRAW